MGRKILLLLSSADCRAYSWQNGKLSAAIRFAANAEGKQQFAAFLQTHRDPAILLTDLIEEDFRQETVPHLRGSERTALIRRKLEQHYRDTPFRQALLLRRREEGRRDDDMLFSALTNPALITPWLEIIQLHQTPLIGIYSVPYISTQLAQDISSDNLLLLSWEKNAGLRQTYFNLKTLRFSRLTPCNDAPFGATALTEAARTQHYLKNLSLLPPGQMLDVHIICHASDRRELEAQLSDNADMRYRYLDIQELARHHGSTILCGDSDATPLFLDLLATAPPHNNYAATEHTLLIRQRRNQRVLFWLIAILTTCGLLWAAANITQAIGLKRESLALKNKTGQLSQQARKISQNFPDSLAPATDMKTAVVLSRKLQNRAPHPQKVLAALGSALERFPNIRINKLSWTNNFDDTGEATASHHDTALVAKSQVIMVDGELSEFSENYRDAFGYLDRFQRLLIQSGYSVIAIKLPLDVSPQGNIFTDAVSGNAMPAQFTLKLSFGPAI